MTQPTLANDLLGRVNWAALSRELHPGDDPDYHATLNALTRTYFKLKDYAAKHGIDNDLIPLATKQD